MKAWEMPLVFSVQSCLFQFSSSYCLFRDNSARLIEQSRCLSHLSHVYHALHQNTRSLMAALQELNAAEEAEENLHEVSSDNFENLIEHSTNITRIKVSMEWVKCFDLYFNNFFIHRS